MAGGITYLNVVVVKKWHRTRLLNIKHQNVIKNQRHNEPEVHQRFLGMIICGALWSIVQPCSGLGSPTASSLCMLHAIYSRIGSHTACSLCTLHAIHSGLACSFCTLHAIAPHNTNNHGLKHHGSESRLLSVMNCIAASLLCTQGFLLLLKHDGLITNYKKFFPTAIPLHTSN